PRDLLDGFDQRRALQRLLPCLPPQTRGLLDQTSLRIMPREQLRLTFGTSAASSSASGSPTTVAKRTCENSRPIAEPMDVGDPRVQRAPPLAQQRANRRRPAPARA